MAPREGREASRAIGRAVWPVSRSFPPLSKRKAPRMSRLPMSARRTLGALLLGCIALFATASSAHAGVEPVVVGQPYGNTDGTKVYAVNSGDTAWMLTSAALVLMMTGPG